MIKTALTAILLASTFAFADHHEGAHMEACKADMEKFCAKTGRDRDAKKRCMKEHKDELSAECKAAMSEKKEEMKDAMKSAMAACESDIQTHCGDVKKGKGRILKCLKKNSDKLSEGCKTEMESHKKHERK